jgi:hypothetical protein
MLQTEGKVSLPTTQFSFLKSSQKN